MYYFSSLNVNTRPVLPSLIHLCLRGTSQRASPWPHNLFSTVLDPWPVFSGTITRDWRSVEQNVGRAAAERSLLGYFWMSLSLSVADFALLPATPRLTCILTYVFFLQSSEYPLRPCFKIHSKIGSSWGAQRYSWLDNLLQWRPFLWFLCVMFLKANLRFGKRQYFLTFASLVIGGNAFCKHSSTEALQ